MLQRYSWRIIRN